MKIPFFYLSLLWMCACQSPQKSTDSFVLNAIIETNVFISADSLFSSVEYIPLETNSNCLIQKISKLIFTDSLFYMLDNEQEIIFAFDKEGKYKDKLNSLGRGEGEYNSLYDFCLYNDTIYALDGASKRILLYNLEFNYLSSIDIGVFGSNIALQGDYMYVYSNFSSEECKQFYKYNRFTGEFTDSYVSFPKQLRWTSYIKKTLISYKEFIYYALPFDYSIYRLGEKEEKVYEIEFNKNYRMPEGYKNLTSKEKDDFKSNHYSSPSEWPITSIDNFYIGDRLIYFSFVQAGSPCSFFFWKNTGREMVGKLSGTDDFLLFSSFPPYIYLDDHIYISYSEPISILGKHKWNPEFKMDEKIDFLENLDIEDNPVLCIHTFKEDL